MSDNQDMEFEEICTEEVDRVVTALELLGESIHSETIKSYIEECASNIYYLVYEDDEGVSSEAA